jgi:hypothetical protein
MSSELPHGMRNDLIYAGVVQIRVAREAELTLPEQVIAA